MRGRAFGEKSLVENLGRWRGWTIRELRDSFRLSLWKDVRKGWEEFILRTSIRIGNGRHTSFWWENWVGDSKLKDVFPSLFKIATHKYATMADLSGRDGDGGSC